MSEIKEHDSKSDDKKPASAKAVNYKSIKYIEKHLALFSAVVTLGAFIVNYLLNVYVFSKAEAFCIDRSWIRFDTHYVIYTAMKSFILLIIYAVWNYIIYELVIKVKSKKILAFSFVILAFEIIYSFYMVAIGFQPFELYLSSRSNFWMIAVASLILAGATSFIGLYFSFSKLHHKESLKVTQLKKQKVRLLIFAAVISMMFYFFSLDLGADVAANQKNYKLYNDYVILAENEDKILCSKIENQDYKKTKKLKFDCRQQYVITIDQNVPIVEKRFVTVKSNSKKFFELLKDGIE